MKKTILFLSVGLLLSMPALASTKCFIAKENNTIIKQEGDCASRHAPCSTFKIPISLMGYDAGLLIDEAYPELPFKEGYPDFLEVWKEPHNPTLWMKNSNLWYSQLVTKNLGIRKFTEYLKKFNYGNQDVSGDKGKNNELTSSWISSSLEISPEEQTVFLQNLLDNKLPVSVKAQEMTKKILLIDNLPDGWKLYGKTGSGSQFNHDKTKKLDLKTGWFIGWIEKEKRTIIFAHYIEDEEKIEAYAGPRAREIAKEKLMQIVKNHF